MERGKWRYLCKKVVLKKGVMWFSCLTTSLIYICSVANNPTHRIKSSKYQRCIIINTSRLPPSPLKYSHHPQKHHLNTLPFQNNPSKGKFQMGGCISKRKNYKRQYGDSSDLQSLQPRSQKSNNNINNKRGNQTKGTENGGPRSRVPTPMPSVASTSRRYPVSNLGRMKGRGFSREYSRDGVEMTVVRRRY